MPLSPVEKLAGRVFCDARQHALDVLNAAVPPGRYVQPFWRVVRHECRDADGASIGISLRERYELSPEYRACYCGRVEEVVVPGSFPHRDCDGSTVVAARGQFAWIWKEGKCSGCELVVRTRKGFFVPCAADRLPDHGRTNDGRPAGPHPGDPRLPRA
jgi:hypothetical protein